jgi:hypothetical protein
MGRTKLRFRRERAKTWQAQTRAGEPETTPVLWRPSFVLIDVKKGSEPALVQRFVDLASAVVAIHHNSYTWVFS